MTRQRTNFLRPLTSLACAIALWGCATTPQQIQLPGDGAVPLYTCCNLHAVEGRLHDVNYHFGTFIPLGTPVTIERVGAHDATVLVGAQRLKVVHAFGRKSESFEQFLHKLFVTEDPQARLRRMPAETRDLIFQGKVTPGMTRQEVLLSLGYPPTHRTPSLDSPEWNYWYNRWFSFKARFDAGGRLTEMLGVHLAVDRFLVGGPEHVASTAQ
ncbi:MAG TPA: outer membrane protein assembly factor BamE [Candidatus Binatia bacterium]|nr:outer membrane protein assembly factor BamE [Candidatus Binatia bacterium]